MSSIFTADISTQLSAGSTNVKTYNTKDNPNMRLFSKSGIYNSADNEIKFFTNNTDALTINSSQKVICDGSLITNLTYNNITGKPTNFQSDWLTTVINKPSLFDGTWTSLSGKPTNFQSDWLTTVINKPSLFDGTWTSLSGTPTNFQSDWNSTVINRPNELLNISNIFVTSNILQNSTNLINYNNLTNTPNLSLKQDVISVSNPLTKTGNTIGLSYDSTLTLNGNQLSVASSTTSSQWTTSSSNVYYNIGNVGIGTNTPVNKLEVLNGSINTNDYKFNNNSLFTYLPYQSPTPSGTYTTTTINPTTFAYTFTGTGQLYVPTDTIIDILLVGSGGRGGINIYSGGGGAGEIVYYPQYAISAGTYDITIGVDSATPANRISSIKKAGVNQLVALGGGNGAYWNYEYSVERVFPPKAYSTTTTRTATTLMGRTCQKYTMTLSTTGITYGSGTYEIYVSTVYSSATQYDGYRMFDFDNASTVNRWAGLSGQYVITTGAVSASSTQYFIDNTYKGDWFVIKLPVPIALTKYDIYQTSTALDRAPKNLKVYGSVSGTSFTLLQTITGATYTSRLYTNTGLSTNTTPYQWYAFAVNNLVGGTTSTLIDIPEFKLYGKEPINIYSSAIGGSGGGGWYNPNLPASVKKGSTFAISQNAQYSKATAGYDPVDTGSYFGGSGGSATGTGRFSTTITGTTTSYGLGGYSTGGTAYATPVATNYGDGGSSGLTQGLGFQGVCILRISTSFITKYNHYLSWDKLLNIQVGDGLSVDPLNGNRITTSWSKDLVNNNLYNNHGGNIGVNCYSTGILERLHIGELGGQKGKLLIGNDYDHIKLSHDGFNAYLDIGGADSYFSIRVDYPPDWVGYNSMGYYDIITILGDGSGFVGIQNITPTCALDVFGNFKASGTITGASLSLAGAINGATTINASGSLSVGTTRTPLATLDVLGTIASINSSTWDHIRMFHDGGAGYIDCGGSENGFALRIENTSVGYPASSYSEKLRVTVNGDVGILNNAPVNYGNPPNLHIGKCGGGYVCDGKITIAKDTNTGSVRQNIAGWNSSFYFVFCGDGGGVNNNATWVQQCYCYFSAPASSLYISSGGLVTMAYGYTTSDQRIKTDIKTIDNALWKVLNLRGVEYTDIRERSRHVGLIAQEVEGIIPELVHDSEETGLKTLAYGNMAGLFVNAIKELNEIVLAQNAKINNLMEILERNGIK